MKAKTVVRPSELRVYAYCPRLYFFETHIALERGLREKLRLALGRLTHIVIEFIAKIRGYTVEEPMEADLGKILLRGRPDYYKIVNGRAIVFEIKTSRGPSKGIWLGDALQAIAYATMLLRRGAREAVIVLDYRGSRRILKVSGDHVVTLFKAMDEVRLVKEWGVIPFPDRGLSKCLRCRYADICYAIDRGAPEGLEEPGSWVKGLKIVTG